MYIDDKWNKIIQFGKKSWTNMPFHYIVPNPSTALIYIRKFFVHILLNLNLSLAFGAMNEKI